MYLNFKLRNISAITAFVSTFGNLLSASPLLQCLQPSGIYFCPPNNWFESTKNIGAVNKEWGVKNFENNWKFSSTTQNPKKFVLVITKD
jgi:hypothetical protein